MKEIKEEAERHKEAKFQKYGVDSKACGGSMKKYAHGGHVEHDDEKEDKALIKKEVKGECLKHRDMGGPIAGGGGSSKLGRGRKGGKGKTQVNIAIGKPGGDAAGPMPPLGLGAPGAAPPMGMAPRINPVPPTAGPAALPPKPPMAAGPMKRGGHVKGKEHGHKSSHHHEHRKK